MVLIDIVAAACGVFYCRLFAGVCWGLYSARAGLRRQVLEKGFLELWRMRR